MKMLEGGCGYPCGYDCNGACFDIECEHCADSGYVERTSGGVWTGESIKSELSFCECPVGQDARRSALQERQP